MSTITSTTKKFRNKEFTPSEFQESILSDFEEIRGSLSIRKQCKWLSENCEMSTGEIAKYLEVRFQQVYQALH